MKAFFIGLRPDPVAQLRVKRPVLRTHGLDTAYALPPTSSELESSVQTFGSGFVGAIFATCFNAPFDVAKVPFSGVRVRYLGTMDEN